MRLLLTNFSLISSVTLPVFQRYGQDIISLYTILPEPEALVSIADPPVITVRRKCLLPRSFTLRLAKQEIGNNRTNFPKPTELYDMISPFGPNILAAEGDEWKAQRKVVNRSFGEHNNRLVWQETCRAVLELFEYWGEQGDGMRVDVPHVLDITPRGDQFRWYALSYTHDARLVCRYLGRFKSKITIEVNLLGPILSGTKCPNYTPRQLTSGFLGGPEVSYELCPLSCCIST